MSRFEPLLRSFVSVVLFTAAGFAVADAIALDRPEPDNPSVFTTLIASDAVVAAIRVAVVFAAAFVVISVIALLSRGQYLTQLGPVRVSDSVRELVVENRALRESLGEETETVRDLKDELEKANEMLDTLGVPDEPADDPR